MDDSDEPLAFPDDFAHGVVVEARRQRTVARRRVAYVACSSLVLAIAVGWLRWPAPRVTEPSAAVAVHTAAWGPVLAGGDISDEKVVAPAYDQPGWRGAGGERVTPTW